MRISDWSSDVCSSDLLATAIDGTPAGYPLEYNDHGLVVLRFDDLSDPARPKPIAAWVNWGEHPERLDPSNLHSADSLAPPSRFLPANIGTTPVFSQGNVGRPETTPDQERKRAP